MAIRSLSYNGLFSVASSNGVIVDLLSPLLAVTRQKARSNWSMDKNGGSYVY